MTAKNYNATLTKKHLLGEGIVERLLRCQKVLFTVVSSISSIVAELELKDVLVEELAEADAASDHATATMSVIAAVGARENKDPSVDRSDQAKALLLEKSIPESLRLGLKLVVPE